jgi:predicted nucleic acid-binding protein
VKKLRIYLDTSVIGCLDQADSPDRMADTLALWEQIKAGLYDVVISDVVLEEILSCAESKRKYLLNMLLQIDYTIMKETKETLSLARRFIEHNVLTQKSFDDCRHIACAVVAGCDIITSWNFKHMVKLRTVNGVRIINLMEGYRTVEIYPPTMLIEGDEQDE